MSTASCSFVEGQAYSTSVEEELDITTLFEVLKEQQQWCAIVVCVNRNHWSGISVINLYLPPYNMCEKACV